MCAEEVRTLHEFSERAVLVVALLINERCDGLIECLAVGEPRLLPEVLGSNEPLGGGVNVFKSLQPEFQGFEGIGTTIASARACFLAWRFSCPLVEGSSNTSASFGGSSA